MQENHAFPQSQTKQYKRISDIWTLSWFHLQILLSSDITLHIFSEFYTDVLKNMFSSIIMVVYN
jgi:hypothetical protein